MGTLKIEMYYFFESPDEVVRLLLSQPRKIVPVNQTNVILMREFLRREALWAKRLSISDDLPFANLALAIRPNTNATTEFEQEITKYSASTAESACLSNAVNWLNIRDAIAGEFATQNLPEPYDPVLNLFLLGGTFSLEHKVFLDVNGKGMHAGMIQKGTLEQPFFTEDSERIRFGQECDKWSENSNEG